MRSHGEKQELMDIPGEVVIDLGDNDPPMPEQTLIAKAVAPSCSISSMSSNAWPIVKVGMLYLAAAISSCPNSVYAFSFVVDTPPDAFNSTLWESLPVYTKLQAIAFTAICFGVGTLLLKNFLPIMFTKTKDTVKHYCDGISEFLECNFILFMSVVAAMSTIALGYDGFIWAGQSVAVLVTIINFILVFGLGIVPMSGLLTDTRRFFNEDWQFQKAIVKELKRIRPEHIPDFENKLSASKLLNEDSITEGLLQLYEKENYIDLEEGENYAKPRIVFNPPQLTHNIKEYLRHFLNFSLGAATSACYFVFVAQNGFEGASLLCRGISNQCDMDNWPYAGQMALAAFTALPAANFGYMAGSTLAETILTSYDYLRTSTWNGSKIISVYVGSGIMGTALAGAAQALTNRPNLFNLVAKSPGAYVFIGGNWLLSLAFNLNTIINSMTDTTINFNQAIRWLEKNPLPKESITALRRFSHFKSQPQNNNVVEIIEDHKVLAT